MKRQSVLLCLLFLAVLLTSCEAFSKPLYTVSRDISGQLGSLSTQDLAENIDRLATDPQKTAALLNELAERDQEEIRSLSSSSKEKILEASVTAVIPTKQLGGMVDKLKESADSASVDAIVKTLCDGAEPMDTTAIETILSDAETLSTADASTLTLAAASLIVSTLQKESGSGSVEDKMEKFKKAIGSNGYSESSFQSSLKTAGFGEATVSSLTVAMNTAQVLMGTAGADKPNRKDDVEKLSFGGYNLGDLLDKMTEGK